MIVKEMYEMYDEKNFEVKYEYKIDKNGTKVAIKSFEVYYNNVFVISFRYNKKFNRPWELMHKEKAKRRLFKTKDECIEYIKNTIKDYLNNQ